MDKQLEQLVNETYYTIRQQQVKERQEASGQPIIGLTDFDIAIAKAIATASCKAINESIVGKKNVSFNVVTAPTGAGKTSNSLAYAVARRKIDKTFTVAFIVKTVLQCEELYKDLMSLADDKMGKDIVVWSSAHDRKGKPEKIKDEYGFIGSGLYFAEELKSAPIVIITHNKWLAEVEMNKDNGVRCCKGNRRDLVYIDENPDLVSLIERTPSDVASLKDTVIQVDPEHCWVDLLNNVQKRMESVFSSNGAAYVSAKLITYKEAHLLSEPLLRKLLTDFNGAMSLGKLERLKETIGFLKACAEGYVFFTRQNPRSFVAYVTTFKPVAGYVLLDATADLSGLVAIMKGMDSIEVPEIDYKNLKIRQIEPPNKYKNPKAVTSTISKAKEYAEWIKEQVMSATKAGDDVLVVMHKKLLHDYELFPKEVGGADWHGRNVKCLHWGTGVGSNLYKDCKHVFLFGEFFKPRRATAGKTLGLCDVKAEDANLRQLQGRSMAGDYLTMHEGDLLRWTKQLACRGNVRNHDSLGCCGEMNLHTSMDISRLICNLNRLFPGASMPEIVLTEEQKEDNPMIKLLTSNYPSGSYLSFGDIAFQTGIDAGKVRTKLQGKVESSVFEAYGWSFATARELGLSGRSKYLTKKPAT
jgi:hypothetical protein